MVSKEQAQTAKTISLIIEELNNKAFVERESEIYGVFLGIIAEANILFLGSPGLAKSFIVGMVRKHIVGARYFEHMLTNYTVSEELFGPVSLKALENDDYTRNTAGKLPEAEIAFLDEFFKASSQAINMLLPIMNERKFHNAGKIVQTPLFTLIGASNELPEEGDALAAAVDRFSLKYRIKTLSSPSSMVSMMDKFLTLEKEGYTPENFVSLAEIKALQKARKQVEVPIPIRLILADIVEGLKGQHVQITPRSINSSIKLLQANAILSSRDIVTEEDFEILLNSLWSDPEHESLVKAEVYKKAAPEKQKLMSFQKALMENAAKIDEFLADKSLSPDIGFQKCSGPLSEIKKLRISIENFKNELIASQRPIYNVTRLLEKVAQVGTEQFNKITAKFNPSK